MTNRNKKGRNMKDVKSVQKNEGDRKENQKGLEAGNSTATPPKQEAKPVLIKVLKNDAKYRGAREAWYKRLKEFDGKPLEEYIKNTTDNCPQLTKNGTAENPTGWVGFFKREGVLQEVTPS